MPRTPIEIDPELVTKLASFGLVTEEIAAVAGCSKDTIERRFMPEMEIGRQKRNASLRRKQFEVAMKGNTGMLIWLGKQYLEQRDKSEINRPDDPLSELLAEMRKQHAASKPVPEEDKGDNSTE